MVITVHSNDTQWCIPGERGGTDHIGHHHTIGNGHKPACPHQPRRANSIRFAGRDTDPLLRYASHQPFQPEIERLFRSAVFPDMQAMKRMHRPCPCYRSQCAGVQARPFTVRMHDINGVFAHQTRQSK